MIWGIIFLGTMAMGIAVVIYLAIDYDENIRENKHPTPGTMLHAIWQVALEAKKLKQTVIKTLRGKNEKEKPKSNAER